MPPTVPVRQTRALVAQFQHDRRLRGALLAEQRVLAHRDVDARAGHLGDRADGARDLAFERAAVVDLLDELGGAKRRAVEDLEADAAARRQALRRELEAQFVDACAGTRIARPPSSS